MPDSPPLTETGQRVAPARARYGFHASHEQISPRQLLADVQQAERAGFAMAMCSDHFAPWSTRQGQSGQAWAWLGAALATTRLTFGTVTAPGQRCHPAVVAQAAGTLAQMFPGRFWMALGTGQNMNEHITGEPWPAKEQRQCRLEESVRIIRALLAGEEVSHQGRVRVDRARLYSLPEHPPALIGPALSEHTAARAATWADGLITINQDPALMRRIIAAYRDAGGSGPLALQVHLSIAPDEDEAMAMARDQWRNHAMGAPHTLDLATPEEFDALGRGVSDEEIREGVIVTSSPSALIAQLRAYEDMGSEQIYLHHIGQDQRPFLHLAQDSLLPAVQAP